MAPDPIDAVVLSGSGYAGAEVLRLLADHPRFHAVATTGHSTAGTSVRTLHPHLARIYPDLNILPMADLAAAMDGDGPIAIFGCGPHGSSAIDTGRALALASELGRTAQVVDLSSDFRHDPATFERLYGVAHPDPALLERFFSAPPDLDPRTPEFASQPGCFTTAVALAVAPLARSGLVSKTVHVSAVTGSTGSGRNPKPGTHHPTRHGNLWGYSLLNHRHVPEMERLTGATIVFAPHSGPFARGIAATCFLERTSGTADDALNALTNAYAGSPFVAVQTTPPQLADVVGTNQCRLSITQNSSHLVVHSVIDNLLKGAAGGAVQWMNRLCGLPDATGLIADPLPWS